MDWKRIIDILEQHCARPGLPLYKTLEVRSQFISDLRSGKSKNPNAEFLAKIITKLNINPEWFEDETKPMFRENEAKAVAFQKSRLDQDIEDVIASQTGPHFATIEARLTRLEATLINRGTHTIDQNGDSGAYTADPEPDYGEPEAIPERIPYMEDIAAGPPIPQSENAGLFARVPAGYIQGEKGDYYAASIRGESMTAAGIANGSAVLIRRADTPRDGAIQVVAWQGRSTLKRLREKEGGGWELHFEDGTNRVIAVESKDCRVQGDFVAVLPPESQIG
jgi:SOS-response transcriptional repressor LexA